MSLKCYELWQHRLRGSAVLPNFGIYIFFSFFYSSSEHSGWFTHTLCRVIRMEI